MVLQDQVHYFMPLNSTTSTTCPFPILQIGELIHFQAFTHCGLSTSPNISHAALEAALQYQPHWPPTEFYS